MKTDALKRSHFPRLVSLLLGIAISCAGYPSAKADSLAQFPLFWGGGIDAPPLTMLIMGKDHTLFYEAYNDASDLNGDNVLDVGYKPDAGFDYFGYFDSHLCYTYTNSRFEPDSTTNDKTCPGKWSGDFLNYITTARIDALRKVLYGGRRIIDTTTETVLERSYIPQDAHSWGKEYESIAHDGYDIRNYTPLSLPATGTRHLFANTTLLKTGNKEPLMRVLPNSKFRIWEWVAIEQPVAGTNCVSGACGTSATTQTASHPNNVGEFQTLVNSWGNEDQKCGSGAISLGRIDTSGSSNNPFTGSSHNDCTHEYYLTVIKGQIYASSDGDYLFATNGDDAVEVLINGSVVTGWYGGHANSTNSDIETRANNTTSVKSINLKSGWHTVEFRHEEMTGGDNWQLLWKPVNGVWAVVPTTSLRKSEAESNVAPTITTYKLQRSIPASQIADYAVRVRVCKSPSLLDKNCKTYTDTTVTPNTVTYKPDGLLQQYGKTDKMLFGLMSGAFTHPYNMRGGILRKNIESFNNEIDLKTGIFKTDVAGIVQTIDKFRIVDFGNDNQSYQYSGGWLATASMSGSTQIFPDWGNPLAEMMYESLRYFSGKTSATTQFMPTLTNGKERVALRDYSGGLTTMDLPAPTWQDPYKRSGTLSCSPAAQLLISDVNPSFDTEYVPGSAWGNFSGDITGLNARNEADAIWTAEYGSSSRMHFIGQVSSTSTSDGAPTAKSVSGLGNIRGLSPSEPTKQGGYYSAGIARYAFKNDLRSDLADIQDINTFSVALASPLPKIVIPVDGKLADGKWVIPPDSKLVTLVPFAKSVGGYNINAAKGQFQPTNSIVDFFIEEFANTDPKGSDAKPSINNGRPSIKFRINYEDVEQGADHDMDAIVLYDLKVNADKTLTISLDSSYAAGSIMQHIGYVISGTTKDGVYLEVRDKDTSESEDPAYFLNTPKDLLPGACDVTSPPAACKPLLLQATRNFTASSSSDVATVLENPLWYAAKYGSEGNEKLAEGEPSPNYFLVTNAGNLQKQLEEAFTRILVLGKATASAISITSTRVSTDTVAYQASFDGKDWSGTVLASKVTKEGKLGDKVWSTDDSGLIPASNDRHIFTLKPAETDTPATGIAFDWDELSAAQKSALGNETVLNWLRGDRSLEGEGNTNLRKREKLFGDVVNSNPLYVGKPKDYSYNELPSGTPGKNTYRTFLSDHAKRTPMLYVGANDGMLHALDAATGEEQFAYIPNAVFPNLAGLASRTYTHRYFVDGSPTIGEAYFTTDNDWHSVLIGTLAAGGRAVFGLDVTDPDSFDDTKVLWEFTDSALGYQVAQMSPQPTIGRLRDGSWAAILGNGFDSGTGAWLFIVNIETGELIRKIQVSNDAENGLSGAALILDKQRHVVAAYAGDLKGNLWKFDLTSTDPSAWNVAFSGQPLFTATDRAVETPHSQPITGPINVGDHPLGGKIVVFGSGQYMRTTDPAVKTLQTAYGIWDTQVLKTNEGVSGWQGGATTTSNSLVEQRFVYEDTINDRTWRVVSGNPITWGTLVSPIKRGWYLNLISPDNVQRGERIVSQPQIIPGTGELLFTSIVPVEENDPCVAGNAYRWIFLVDMLTGGVSDWTRFDVNGDGVFNQDDVKTITTGSGTNAKKTLLTYTGFKDDFGGAATAIGTGGTDVILGTDPDINRGPPRQSWRQLR